MAEISAGQVRGGVAPVAGGRRRWLLLAVVLGVAALLGLLFWGMLRGPKAPIGVAVPLNRPAPEFTLAAIDGTPLNLSALRGKTVVLNVWASWCEPCKEEADELNRSFELYKGRDVVFVGLAYNDDDGPVREFVKQYRVAYPIALDPEGRIAIDLGVTGVPETYLIDPQGRMTQKWVGPITARQLNGLLAPLGP